MNESVQSPCVNICALNREDICVGCGRSLGEVTEWVRASNARRRVIVEAARVRLAELQASAAAQQ